MPPLDEKIAGKIRKLLSLAGNNPSREEAESAMLAAQTMLARHGLSMSDLPCESSEVGETCLTDEGRRVLWWQKDIAVVVARNFRCDIFLRMVRGAHRIVMVGRPTDAEVAGYVIDLALRTADREAKRYVAREKKQFPVWDRFWSRCLRNDFLRGYISGLRESFRRHVEATGTELMIVRPQDVTDYMENLSLRQLRASGVLSAGSADARQRGHQAGSRFSYRGGLREGSDVEGLE